MKVYNFIHLETDEENRVDYPSCAEMIDFQICKTKKEAIKKFNDALKELKENNINAYAVDFMKNYHHKKEFLKDVYFNCYEYTRHLFVIEKEI